ncbi:protein ced-11, partial [Trichonephila clavata]
PQGIADAEFCENYLKPELSRKISEKFPKLRDNSLSRNIFRDRIMDIIRYAKQNEQIYLTVLNIYEHSCNLENLGNHLLRSLFKSQVIDNTNWHAQMHKDLYLTLDWNSPHVAMSEVFLKDPSNKFKIDKDFFDEAVLRPQRESFVDLFLNQGFQVHKYLTPKRLILLFKKVRHQEFFQTICWEGALGYGPVSNIKRNFIETDLNWLIEKTTSMENFVSSQELSLNAMGMYCTDPSAAERKAKVLLTFWATYTNRILLAKTLWKHADQPIHLALVLSMMIERLTLYVTDTSLKVEMEESSREFADIATSMLDACYIDTPDRAFDVLNEESPGWAYNTAVDIAAEGQNKRFLSHICCQKWLTNEFFGKVKIRELSWGAFTVPTGIKVLLCAFLIFPMYAWTIFQTKECISTEDDKDIIDFDSENEDDNKNLIKLSSPDTVPKEEKTAIQRTWKSVMWNPSSFRRYVIHHPPLWKMVYLMWSAPITKFWTFQIFYIIYLAFFSIAVLWPSCGNYMLDLIVCCWTSLLALESVHPAVRMRKKYKAKAFILKIMEIVVMFVFVLLYLIGRILPLNLIDAYSTRVILCLGLIYFYYRIIYIYLPISPTLGPLLYRVKLMVLVDFINFMRMTILVIISGGIVIHAVMYPDYPFNKELFRRTFHKAWFSLFMTPITDLSGDSRCNPNSRSYSNLTCRAGEFDDWKCPNVGLWSYIFNIQYFVLLKLILLTLLYALFSATASKLSAESDAIWKFQRYHLVVDFSNRLRLPAPLNVISYIIILLQFIRWLFCRALCCLNGETPPEGAKSEDRRFSIKDYTYWNQLAQEYDSTQQTKEMEQAILEKQMDMIQSLMEDFVYHKQMMQSLKSSVRELERLMNYSHVHLENIRHLANRESSVTSTWDAMTDTSSRNLPPVMNILSRRSPYPGTRVQRFPVPDKYVPWEVMWISYDPVAFTLQRSDFPVILQSHVDEDILLLREKNGPQQALPVYAWNSVSVNPAGIGLDRQCWITSSDGSALIYKLDSEGVPQNPMGRTGLRGRGSLPRWGPNHYVHAIITRFQKAREAFLSTKGLEFVVLWTERRFQLSIPGGFVAGEHRYEVIKSMFKPQFTGNAVWIDSNSIIKFFRDCVIAKINLSESSESFPSILDNEESLKVVCDIVHKGYMDDPSNTDQAWKEVELWHIHFDEAENVSEKLQVKY